MDGGSPRRSLLAPIRVQSSAGIDGRRSPLFGEQAPRSKTALSERAPLLPGNRFEVESPDVYLENLRARSRQRKAAQPPRRPGSTPRVYGLAVIGFLLILLVITTSVLKHTHKERKAEALLVAEELAVPPPAGKRSRRAEAPPASMASDEDQAKAEEAAVVNTLNMKKQQQNHAQAHAGTPPPQAPPAATAPKAAPAPTAATAPTAAATAPKAAPAATSDEEAPAAAAALQAPAPEEAPVAAAVGSAPAPVSGPVAVASDKAATAPAIEAAMLQKVLAEAAAGQTAGAAVAPAQSQPAVPSSEAEAGALTPQSAPAPTPARVAPPPPQTLLQGIGSFFSNAVAGATAGTTPATKQAPSSEAAAGPAAAAAASPPPRAFLSTAAAALAAVTRSSPPPASTAPKVGVGGFLADADKVLPAGIPPAPDGVPQQQWADTYWFDMKGAPAPEGMPPAPSNLKAGQWAANWVFQQQQRAQSAGTGSGGFANAPAPGSGPDAGELTKTSLAEYDSLAVCNDGSPGAFYYTAGSDPTTWLIYLEGGLWCWDQATCQERQANGPSQVSSTTWPDTMSQNGIFDTDETLNPFATANKVYVAYCSSDAWTGDQTAEATEAAYGFSFGFHGRRILRATLEALHQDFGMGAAEGTKILLGGCSAGARGAMFNVDSVAALVPQGITALLDSSLWINVQPYEPSITSLADQCQAALPLFNATGVLNAQCVAAQAPGDEYLCLMGQYLLPYLNTPYFLYESQFDAFQLPYNMGGMPTVKNASEMTYANDWQGSLIAVIQNLPAPNQPDSGIFSLSCLRHCLTMGSAFWGAMIGDVSYASAAGAWFYDGQTSKTMAKCYTYQRCMFC